MIRAQIQQVALARDAFAIKHVEFSFAKRSGDFILHDFDLGPRPRDLIAFLDGADASDINPHRGVKLQSSPTGGSFGITKHHADFLPNLINKDKTCP